MHLSGNVKRFFGYACVLLLLISTGFARTGKKKASHQSHPSTKVAKSHVKGKGKSSRRRAKPKRARGQQTIQNDRAREIQQALIREHYLDGEPSGSWDQRTKDAMTRYQSDNGWQTTVVPDSRALIKLGLGPNYTDLLNPKTAVNSSALADSETGRGDMRAGDTQR